MPHHKFLHPKVHISQQTDTKLQTQYHPGRAQYPEHKCEQSQSPKSEKNEERKDGKNKNNKKIKNYRLKGRERGENLESVGSPRTDAETDKLGFKANYALGREKETGPGTFN